MGPEPPPPRTRLPLPLLLLGVILAATLVTVGWTIEREREQVASADQRAADEAAAQLNEAYEGTVGGLRGLRGLYNAIERVTPEQFARASSAVLIQHPLVGTQWVAAVDAADRPEVETRLGGPIVTTTPAGARRRAPDASGWAVVIHAAPRAAHQRAVGLDHLSNPARRPALIAARDGGKAAMSAPNRLGIAGRPVGIQIFLPVYEQGMPARTPAQRRAALRGWLGGVYRLDKLAQVAFGGLEAESLQVLSGGRRIIGDEGPQGSGSHMIRLGGQRWEVRARSGEQVSPLAPIGVGLGGLAAVIMVGLLVLQSRGRELSALRMLDERRERFAAQAALRVSEERNRTIVEAAHDGILSVTRDGGVATLNPAARSMFARDDEAGGAIEVGELLALRHDATEGTVMEALLTASRSGRTISLAGRRGERADLVIEAVASEVSIGDEPMLTVIARDVTERRRAEAEEVALRRVATAIASESEPEVVFDMVARQVGELYRATCSRVVRFNNTNGNGGLIGRWGRSRSDAVEAMPLHGPHTAARVAATGEPCIAFDYAGLGADGEGLVEQYGIRSGIAAPVRLNGQLWGAVEVASEMPEAFAAGAERDLERFSELIAMAIANADARARLIAWAATDELTGLPNQRTFHDRLAEEVERAHRHGRRLSLALFDVDLFKQINDLHGHPVGDRVLIEIGERLQRIMRAGDIVARIGGEEFAWIMVDTDDLGAWRGAERARVEVESKAFADVGAVTISAGVCELAPTGSAGEIFRLADVALYWAKAHGRNVCFRYSPDVIEVLSAEERLAQMERTQRIGSIMVLARAVDAKDPSTQRHSERVADLAARIARELGWSGQDAALLHEAALVHDVGKIGVPDAILVKQDKLTHAEYAQVKTHAELGARIVEGGLSPDQVAWVRGHHERYDGSGYPDRLRGDHIPQGALILGLADAWDAMTEVRLYQTGRGERDAIAEVAACAGTQFWPDAVAALIRLWERAELVLGAAEQLRAPTFAREPARAATPAPSSSDLLLR
jgi:diguanylate cyclase (GGDEF)-like protein/putative nucleotidyltransferase with HDIG domain/PAS domain S-box-containing protein